MSLLKKRKGPASGPKRPKKARKPKKIKKKKVKKPRKKRYYKLNLPKPPRVKRPRFSFPSQPKLPRVAKPRKDKARTRTRYFPPREYRAINMSTGISIHTLIRDGHPSDKFTDRTVKPCNMSRVTSTPFSGVKRRCYFDGPNGPIYAVLIDNYASLPLFEIDPVTTQYVWLPFVNHLKVKKLATSNQADLMTAFAEFDETIAMMNVKAVKQSSYGSVKWGWMPLVSDIMAANDAANNVKKSLLSGNTRSHKYNATHGVIKTTGDIPYLGGILYHKWDVKIKHTGIISYPNDVLAFYDYMGFHPSPKLLWDVIPLTFAIDTILPIGDMLKALSPAKGWVKSANFTGWRVITATVTEHFKVPPKEYYGTVFEADPGPVTFVTREYLSGSALDQKTFRKEIEALKLPTWEQAFDLTYLADAFYNRGKKLLSPHVYRKRKRK